MDRVDWRILAELQQDARLSFNELSRRVNLSAPAVADRVRRLQDTGVITGYHAQVDPTRAGRAVRAIVRMHCYGPTCLLRDPAVLGWPEVQTMHRVTGDDCSVLLVVVEDIPAFETLLDRLSISGSPPAAWCLTTFSRGARSCRLTRSALSRPADEGRPGRRESGEVEAIETHDLVPRGDEVAHELLLRVVARVDLRKCTELGVRPEC